MKHDHRNPHKNKKDLPTLDQEEREILEAFESGKLEPVAEREIELQKHRESAAATLKKVGR